MTDILVLQKLLQLRHSCLLQKFDPRLLRRMIAIAQAKRSTPFVQMALDIIPLWSRLIFGCRVGFLQKVHLRHKGANGIEPELQRQFMSKVMRTFIMRRLATMKFQLVAPVVLPALSVLLVQP